MEQTTVFVSQSLVVTAPYENKITDDLQPYLDLITSQHRTKPNFNAWLTSALTAVYDGLSGANSIVTAFDIDVAVGVQLDVIGLIVGRSRVLPFQPNNGEAPTLDDSNYRIALKAKIAQNQWDGTIPSIYKIWDSLFTDDLILNIVDNQNMSMSVLIESQADHPIIMEMVAAGYIVPKPAGVGLTIIEVTSVPETQYISGWVTTNEVITLDISNFMVYQHNYFAGMVTTVETLTLTQ